MQELVLATKNLNKVHELQQLLEAENVHVRSLAELGGEDVAETGTTFEDNARLKVQSAVAQFHLPTLADDSGLMVDYLHGQPGVRSARYAGDHNDAANNARLLTELGGVAPTQRQAQFVTTMVYFDPQMQVELVAEGKLVGQIMTVPQGNDGFGYDPLFYVSELDCTLAQLSLAEKNKISHRARALQEFLRQYRRLNLQK
ncbi:RdgB/HAM1 family non-canonical purine NTP pyrophosphatase [Lactobacillus sp. DCY120]|uniref:dITP/XTP pyrophosphatase n=1 Tax=Bombilactobacillus apium TaxID=2675299 RepID=A0A850R8F0_9LACO|nr:RdgB/HAM1 family non-canonical purine NTP pyrophosphatase [Bombilactobacillus apium]NVY97127.1 RdgB/HAM1 family non-canonical purine NTP pyrophosphatase [Bombilactobacillus apium]